MKGGGSRGRVEEAGRNMSDSESRCKWIRGRSDVLDMDRILGRSGYCVKCMICCALSALRHVIRGLPSITSLALLDKAVEGTGHGLANAT